MIETSNNKKIKIEEHYRPPKEAREIIAKIYELKTKWESNIFGRTRKVFLGYTPLQYWRIAREKFWGYIPLSEDEDKQKFITPALRSEVIRLLAKVVSMKEKPRFVGVEGNDFVLATILNDLFTYWRRQSGRNINELLQYLYAIITGTVVVYIDYYLKNKEYKEVSYYDPQTGDIDFNTKEILEEEVREILVPLEDFLFPKIWEPDIQKQGKVIWRTKLTWDNFISSFGEYENSEYVLPASQIDSQDSVLGEIIRKSISEGVEVIRYFDVENDQYIILANGVWLNPLPRYKINPLPFNHKKLPFAKTMYEPADPEFFYGASLVMNVKSPLEFFNKLMELLLLRERKAISAPIITSDPTIEIGTEYEPGRIYQVGTDVSQYKELPVSPSSPSVWNALIALNGMIQSGTAGRTEQVLPSRQPKTATERLAIAQAERETAGLYKIFYEHLLEQKAWLVIKTMIQFFTSEKVKKVVGGRKFYKTLELSEVPLVEGGTGKRELRFVETAEEIEKLKEESILKSLLTKKKVEIVEVPVEAIKDIKFDIQVEFEPQYSPQTERALFADFIAMITNTFGNIIDPKKVLRRFIEKMGENITDYLPDALIEEYEKENIAPKKATVGKTVNALNQTLRGIEKGPEGPLNRVQKEWEGGIIEKLGK